MFIVNTFHIRGDKDGNSFLKTYVTTSKIIQVITEFDCNTNLQFTIIEGGELDDACHSHIK
jgi:hypothetical protein